MKAFPSVLNSSNASFPNSSNQTRWCIQNNCFFLPVSSFYISLFVYNNYTKLSVAGSA